MVAAAVGLGVVAGGLGAAAIGSSASHDASSAQQASAQAGIAEQQRQFDSIQKLMEPYVTAGNGSLSAQQDLLGLNGTSAQSKAISALQTSPYFTAMQQQGTNSILSNASATGGLRGGNTQGALAQFTPALLAQTFQQQFGNLGTITGIGQSAAAGVGNAGLATGQGVSNLLQQQGAAAAGGYLGQGAAYSGALNSFGSGLGYWAANRTPSPTVPAVGYGSNASGFNGTLNNPSAYVAPGI